MGLQPDESVGAYTVPPDRTLVVTDLQTNAAGLRPVLHALRDAGKVKVKGKARATRYSAV